eukprot:jgi/Mesvir1/2926/Mv13993-RA.2
MNFGFKTPLALPNMNKVKPEPGGVNHADAECCVPEGKGEEQAHCAVCRPPMVVYTRPKAATKLGVPLALAALTGFALKRLLFPAKDARVSLGSPQVWGSREAVDLQEAAGKGESRESKGNENEIEDTETVVEGRELPGTSEAQEPRDDEELQKPATDDGMEQPVENEAEQLEASLGRGAVRAFGVDDAVGDANSNEQVGNRTECDDVFDVKGLEEVASPRAWSPLAATVQVGSEAAATDGSQTPPASPGASMPSLEPPAITKLRAERVNTSPLSSGTRTPRMASRPYDLPPHDKVGGVHQRAPAHFPVPPPQAEVPAPGDVDFSDLLLELEASGELASSDWTGGGQEGGVYPELLARSASGKEPAGGPPSRRPRPAGHVRAGSHHALDMDMTDVLEAMEEEGGVVMGTGADAAGNGGSDNDDVDHYRTGGVDMREILGGMARGWEDGADDRSNVDHGGHEAAPGHGEGGQEDGMQKDGDKGADGDGPVSPFLAPRAKSASREATSGDSSLPPGAAPRDRDLRVRFPPDLEWPGRRTQLDTQAAIDASIIETELATAEHMRHMPAAGEEEASPSSTRTSPVDVVGNKAATGATRPPIRRLSSIVFAGIGPEQLPQPGIPTVGSSALLSVADKIQARAVQIGKLVASIKEGPHTQVINPISQLETELHVARSMLEFGAAVAQETPVREAGIMGYQRVIGTTARFNVWQDVYSAVTACHADEKRCTGVTPVEARYMEYLMRGYHRRGMGLTPERQQHMRDLRTRIRHLGVRFQENVVSATERRMCLFSRDELQGLDERVLQALFVQADGCYVVPARVDLYLPIMQECVRERTRKAMEMCFSGRAVAENMPLLQELLALRHEGAQLLGYESHAHYVLQNSYLEEPKKVHEFLEQLEAKLRPLAQQELGRLRELKQACEGNADVTVADLPFYLHRLEDEMLGMPVDHEAIMAYFPLRVVVARALDLLQVSLGLVAQEEVQNNVWDDSVQLFSLWDARYPDNPSLVGHLYLDLYHREGKEPGAMSIFHLQPGCQAPFFLSDHGKQPPVSTLVADFPADDASQPTLLTHGQVLQLMGKLGIMMHQVCSKVDHARFAGGMVESDMQDIAGIIYEKFCWLQEVLLHLSAHKDTGAAIPTDLLAPLLRRHALQQRHFVLFTMRQILLARLDLELHSGPVDDPRRLLTHLHRKILGLVPLLGTNMLASFEHLIAGYDALYFAYLWKEVRHPPDAPPLSK